MLYELGLAVTLALCGWITLDALSSPGTRRRSLPIACLTASVGVWATAELLLSATATAEGRLFGRRLLFLGATTLPTCWLWVAAQAARPSWWRRHPWLVAVAGLPGLALYATLYLDGPLLFADGRSPTPRHGPAFPYFTGYAWALGALGLAYFAVAAARLQRASPTRMAALCAGVGVPMAGNGIYLALGSGAGAPLADPTPILLGVSAVLIRAAVIDSGLTLAMPVGRRDVIEQLDIGILMADLEDRVVDANGAARALLGGDRIDGCSLRDLLATAGRDPSRCLESRCFPLRSQIGVVGTGAVLTDRTVEEQAQRRLQLAARLETVGSLTAGIAHEVNNPLAFVRANLSQLEKLAYYTTQLSDELPKPVRELGEDASELVAETVDGIDRITRIVERLLTFARDEPNRLVARPLDLAHVAPKAVAMARVGAAGDAIETHFEPAPRVMAREGDLVQLILNLLVNAIQATGGRGPILVEIGAAEGGAALRVLDRGPGIAPEVLPHVFDPFYTTKPAGEGTGLGLSLSYDLARQHGGRLEAENRLEGGAAFTLWLPEAPSDRAVDN